MTQLTTIKKNGTMSESVISDNKAKMMRKLHKVFGIFSKNIYVFTHV